VASLAQPDAIDAWFSLLAPTYDQCVAPLFWPEKLQRRPLEELPIQREDRTLDLGCGTGETSTHLGDAAVDGLDRSRDQLMRGKQKDALEPVRFVQADGAALPYVDNAFDHVVSVGSMLYWSHPVEILKEAARVTKPGGSILVMGFHRRSLSPWNPVQNAQELAMAPYYQRHTKAEAAELFRDAGWTDLEQTVTGPAWCPDLVLETVARQPRDVSSSAKDPSEVS